MSCWVQFVTVPTVDTPGSLLFIHFDEARYYFGNFAEGTQRACIENSIRNVKTKEVFLTGKTEWVNTGGLMGFVLSLADIVTRQHDDNNSKTALKKKKEAPQARLGIHGGPNILHSLAVGRRFIFRKNMPLDVEEYTSLDHKEDFMPTWFDDRLKVWQMRIKPSNSQLEYSNSAEADDARKTIVSLMFGSSWRSDSLMEQPLRNCVNVQKIYVRNPKTKSLEDYTGPPPGSPEADPDLIVLTRKPWPGALVNKLPPASPDDSSMCYIAKSHPQRGRFNAQKAIELGIEPGPAFGQLTNGLSVKSKNGTIVTPDMVLAADRPGSGVAILNLPTVDYIDSLANRAEFTSSSVMAGLETFVWQLGKGVASDPRMQDFYQRFPNATHLVSSPDHCPNRISFTGAAENAIRLSKIAPNQFKVPVYNNVPVVQPRPQLFPGEVKQPQSNQLVPIVPKMKVLIAPKFEIVSEEAAPLLDTRTLVDKMPKPVLELADKGRKLVEQNKQTQTESDLPGQDAEIITLGTGSSSPSKDRNVSGTLVRVPGYGSYLLDCGEGTLGQLRRMFEPEELQEVFQELRMIWISHLHADHHLGTVSVIKAWHEAVHGPLKPGETSGNGTSNNSTFSIDDDSHRLAIVAHNDMISVLYEYSSAENFGFSKCLPLRAMMNAEGTFLMATSPEDWTTRAVVPPDHKVVYKKVLRLKDLKFCRVSHCFGAYGVALEFAHGFKVSYSGDCRPSRNLTQIGAGSTVLIHEATFDDELQGDARAKKHSTTSEAIAVGASMGAKRVVLTHFSQRYSKIPVMSSVKSLQVDFEDSAVDPSPAEKITVVGDGKVQDTASHDVVLSEESMDLDMETATSVAEQEDSMSGGGTLSNYVEPSTTSTKGTTVPLNDMKVCVAFDYMRVRVDEIGDMEHYTPAFMKLFEDMDASDPDDRDDSDHAPATGGKGKKQREDKKANQNQGQFSSNKSSNSTSKESNSNGKTGPSDAAEPQNENTTSSTAKADHMAKNSARPNQKLSKKEKKRQSRELKRPASSSPIAPMSPTKKQAIIPSDKGLETKSTTWTGVSQVVQEKTPATTPDEKEISRMDAWADINRAMQRQIDQEIKGGRD